jgi:hypothetical protein
VVDAVVTVLLAAAAAGEEESSKTLFYVLGSLLAVFAVAIALLGISRHDSFPPTATAFRGVMAVSTLLVVAVLASAVLTS